MRRREQVLNKHGILGHGQTHWEQGFWVSFMFPPDPPARLLENPLIKLLTATGLVSTLTLSCVVALC